MKADRPFLVLMLSANLAVSLVAASCVGERVRASARSRYLRCFEVVWRTVNEKFFDPTFGGLDWKEVHDRYGPLIAAAKSDGEFYKTINQMVFELGVSHIGVVPPDEKDQLEPVASAEAGVGVGLRLLDGVAVITSVVPGSPGDRAGLRPGFAVRSLGGRTIDALALEVERIPPLHERNERKRATGKLLERLYGRTGAVVSIVTENAEGRTRESRLTMTPREGQRVLPGRDMPPFYVEFEAKRLGDIGYVRFNAFLPPVQERIAEAARALSDVSGLILDLRGNHGGMFFVRKPVIDLLVPERRLIWSFKGRNATRKVFAEPAEAVYGGPLVVLIDVMSASSAEEVAGGLQAIGRACVIGERTAGIDLVMEAVSLPNGAVFVYPSEQTRTADGTVLESRGVIPDIEVELERPLLLRGIDSQLKAAIGYIRTYHEQKEMPK